MNEHQHYVSGFFATRDEALEARAILIERDLPRSQIQIYQTDLPATAPVPTGDSNAVLKDVFVDGATASEKVAPGGKEGWLDSLVRDAIANGQIVLVVDARTVEQTQTARRVIEASVGDFKDVAVA